MSFPIEDKAKAIVWSAVMGGLMALNCYLFFEDGILVGKSFSDKSDGPSRDESEDSESSPKSTSQDEE